MKHFIRFLNGCGIVVAVIFLVLNITGYVAAHRAVIPDNLNISASTMTGMNMSGASAQKPPAGAILVSSLVGPQSGAPVKRFALTA